MVVKCFTPARKTISSGRNDDTGTAAFVIGFLLGDRQAVTRFNEIIMEHNERLERLFTVAEPIDADEEHAPTLH